MAAAAVSPSFVAARGVAADDIQPSSAAARRGGAWCSVVAMRTTATRAFPQAALAASPPSRHGSAAGKKRDEVAPPIPMAFDPLGARGDGGGGATSTSAGGGGLLLWSPETAGRKATKTSGARVGQETPPTPVSAERLDRWVRNSVTDIVKRIEEAPFLSFIFANDGGAPSAVRLEREPAAEADDWPSAMRRWGSAAPDGVILVEELKGHDAAAGEGPFAGAGSGLGSAATRTWGVLVQGRGGGADCTACYILNTCRVRSALGCCTHFCLVRAQCYGDSAEAQLRKAWLAYGHRQWPQQ